MKSLDKVVDLIIKELFNVSDIDSSKQRVIMHLLESGIELEDIDKAFSFIVKKIKENNNSNVVLKKLRILTEKERSYFSKEAQHSLYSYYYNDAFSWQEMERIISDVLKTGRVLDVVDLNLLVEKNLFAKNYKNIMVNRSEIH